MLENKRETKMHKYETETKIKDTEGHWDRNKEKGDPEDKIEQSKKKQ